MLETINWILVMLVFVPSKLDARFLLMRKRQVNYSILFIAIFGDHIESNP